MTSTVALMTMTMILERLASTMKITLMLLEVWRILQPQDVL